MGRVDYDQHQLVPRNTGAPSDNQERGTGSIQQAVSVSYYNTSWLERSERASAIQHSSTNVYSNTSFHGFSAGDFDSNRGTPAHSPRNPEPVVPEGEQNLGRPIAKLTGLFFETDVQ
jgi:hypothetical protein